VFNAEKTNLHSTKHILRMTRTPTQKRGHSTILLQVTFAQGQLH